MSLAQELKLLRLFNCEKMTNDRNKHWFIKLCMTRNWMEIFLPVHNIRTQG